MRSPPSSNRRTALILGIIGCVVVVSPLAWFGRHRNASANAIPPSIAPVGKTESPQATSVLSDPVKIFRRAFWRSPVPEDRILHAERREWADSDGLKKWQWFIAVEPSPGLLKYLQADNSFGLVALAAKPDFTDPPAWFVFGPAEVDVLAAPRGSLRLIFSKTRNLVYATDSGSGFQPGAPEAPVHSAPPANASGRLPATPPPTPSGR